jgi:hypothetical protein
VSKPPDMFTRYGEFLPPERRGGYITLFR